MNKCDVKKQPNCQTEQKIRTNEKAADEYGVSEVQSTQSNFRRWFKMWDIQVGELQTGQEKNNLILNEEQERRSEGGSLAEPVRGERTTNSELLRWQSVFELHTWHVVIQRHRDQLLHGADETVLLTTVLDHQGVRLVGVKHDVVGRHN